VYFHTFYHGVLMLMDDIMTNSGVEAKGSVGTCRPDSTSTCELRGELLECRVCVVIAKAWWTDIFGRSGAILFTSYRITEVL
jgi:hypothetical protein